MVTVYAINGMTPVVHPEAYVHPRAVLIGDVIVGPRVYVAPGASLRGDYGRLVLEEGCNIQDNCVMHGYPGTDTVVGKDGHIGHGAVLHGCRLEPDVLVGMNAVVMDGAVVGKESVIAAMCFVKAGDQIAHGPWSPACPARSGARSPTRNSPGSNRARANIRSSRRTASRAWKRPTHWPSPRQTARAWS